MHVNYRFLLDFAREQAPRGRILDYGCGKGEVVQGGRAHGLEICGVEAFYEGGNRRAAVEKLGYLGTVIRELRDGKIPFEENSFDLVLSNQVFEHVPDLTAVLSEIARVLKPEGKLLSLFPSNEVIREGHIGIPFVHWFPRGSGLRYAYAFLLRGLGAGYFKENRTTAQWTREKLCWLDHFTYYRSRKEIYAAFTAAGFKIQHFEKNYITYRLARSQLFRLGFLLRVPLGARGASYLCRRLAGLVLLARKSGSTR